MLSSDLQITFLSPKKFIYHTYNCVGYFTFTLENLNVLRIFHLLLVYSFSHAPKRKDYLNNLLIHCVNIASLFQLSFTFNKCDYSGNPNSCELFMKDVKNDNICKYLPMKHQTWSKFVSYFDRNLTCPIQPVSNLNYHYS